VTLRKQRQKRRTDETLMRIWHDTVVDLMAQGLNFQQIVVGLVASPYTSTK